APARPWLAQEHLTVRQLRYACSYGRRRTLTQLESCLDTELPGTRRPGGRTARTRAAVLQAVIGELVENGYAGTTVERVAAGAREPPRPRSTGAGAASTGCCPT